jgi:trans-2,3-dihydro-3-hydroxyanthranilate isomerase
MKTYRIKIVDAFTQIPFRGNPAGVVLDANGLTDEKMQALARELNLSETAFILAPTEQEANLQIRWFTNNMEVPLCGHATIASFHALAEEGMEGMRTKGQHYFRLQTKSGILAVRVEKNFYQTMTEFELPIPKFKIVKKLPVELWKSLGVSKKETVQGLPIVLDSYLYIPVMKMKTISKLDPEFQSLSQQLSKLKVSGVCVFSLETKEKNSSVHSRFFAPNCGINEDPVTGSANGPLGYYLQKYVLPKKAKVPSRILSDGRTEFIGEQGDEIKRAGRVKIRLKVQQNDIESISIVGEAVTIFDATLRV